MDANLHCPEAKREHGRFIDSSARMVAMSVVGNGYYSLRLCGPEFTFVLGIFCFHGDLMSKTLVMYPPDIRIVFHALVAITTVVVPPTHSTHFSNPLSF